MSLNQNIRSQPVNFDNINNPYGLFNYLVVGDNLKGAGAPSPNIGTINSKYIDTVSGIEYIKGADGVWDAFVNFGTFAPPVIIPDPLSLIELDVDTIRGNSGDSVAIDLGPTGDLNISLDGNQFIKVNGDNIKIQGNGNIISQSSLIGYELQSNNTIDKYISIVANSGLIQSVGNQPLTIEALNAGQPVNIKTEGSAGADVVLEGKKVQFNSGASVLLAEFDNSVDNRLIMYNGASQAVLLRAQGMTKLNAGDLVINHESTNASINNNVKGLGSHTFTNSTVGSTARIDSQTKTLEFLGTDGDVNIRNVTLNDHLLLSTDGTGQVKIPNGGLDLVNNPVINVSAINNGNLNGQFGSLSVNAAGALIYAKPQTAHTFTWGAVGGNTVNEYGEIGGFTVAPGDVAGVYIPWGGFINMVSASLSYSAAWTFGAGTASIQIGYIPSGVPMINANFVNLTTLPILTNTDFYQVSLGTNTNVSLPLGRLCARLNVAGAAATSTNAELVCTIWTH